MQEQYQSLKRIQFCSTFFVKIHKVFKVNISSMTKCNLRRFILFKCNLDSLAQHLLVLANKICDKSSRNVQFSSSNKQFIYYLINFFVTNPLSNNIMKDYYYFKFTIAVLFNILIDIFHIILIFNKEFGSSYSSRSVYFMFF